jgi:CPA1 family monovalent cation:H+ antiporter
MKSVERREKKLNVPMLDLGLSAELLIKKVPLFNGLEDSAVKKIASALKPRLTLPGEKIINEGDKADSMYFISSGAVQVIINDENFILATGDFFGEIALITDNPRNAHVISSGFCDLLVLETAEFKKLVEAHPDMKEVIENTAQARLAQDEA